MNRKHSGATRVAVPSSRLLQAALAGLVALSQQACSSSGDQPPDSEPHITSSSVVQGLTADGFQSMCDMRGGVVEVMAHCGGLASARGFSYDLDTQTLSEHTCRGANTCAGWNCVTDS